MSLTVNSRRKFASTGLEVTAPGIGTCPLGGLYCDVPTDQALEVLLTAWDLGIRYFDTAPFYGSTRADASPEIVMRAEALRAVCDDYHLTLAAAAIHFPMRHPAVTCVVIGANTAAQLCQNVDWFNTDLPGVIWADLEDALEESRTEVRKKTC